MKLQSVFDLKSVEVPNDDIGLHRKECKLSRMSHIFEFGFAAIN